MVGGHSCWKTTIGSGEIGGGVGGGVGGEIGGKEEDPSLLRSNPGHVVLKLQFILRIALYVAGSLDVSCNSAA